MSLPLSPVTADAADVSGGHSTLLLKLLEAKPELSTRSAERAGRLSRLVSYGLLGAGLFLSWSWLVWWLLTRFVGLRHPRALDEQPLDGPRAALAILGLVLFALTFVTEGRMRPLPTGIYALLSSEFYGNYPILAASLVLFSVPVLVLYFFFQREFIEGLTAGAVKH